MSHYHYDFEKEAIKGKFLSALLGGAKDLAVRGGTKALDFGKKMISPGTSAYQAAKATGKSTARAFGEATKDQAVAAGKVMGDAGTAVYNNPTAQSVGKKVTETLSPVTSRVGNVGKFTTDVSRNALNMGDDAVARMRGQNRPAGAGWGLGDAIISPTAKNPSSLRNVGVGSGVLYGGARATGLTGGSSNDPQDDVYTPVAPGAQMPTPIQNYSPSNSGGGGFLGGIPKEMQYAAAAGVPLALLGAYMGGGKGLATGALGLGAMGLGAAGSGYFGDGARRMVGQGANSLMGLFGGNQNGDMMSQIDQLSNLSPEFGVTMLMGKNPGMSREDAEQMYQFLTQNKGVISKLAPMITGAKTPMAKAGALLALSSELEKASRCWKGYEPVPGKAPYSNNSCRPAGSGKKKKKQEKTSAHSSNLESDDMLTPYDFGRALVKSAAFPFDANNVLTSGAGGQMSGGSSPTMSLARGPAAQQMGNRPAAPAPSYAKSLTGGFTANSATHDSSMRSKPPTVFGRGQLPSAKPMLNTGLQPKPGQPAVPRAPAQQGNPGLMTGTSPTGRRWDMKDNPMQANPVGSMPVPTLSLARPDGMRPQHTLTTSGTRPGQVTPVAPANTPVVRPSAAPKMAPTQAATPAAKPEMTADDYSSQAKKMLAELNARRRTAGGEVGDAGKINQQVNELLGRANKMRNAPGYKPGAGEQNIAQVQQLNADRARAGGEVANVGQRMQSINNASRNYDTASWNRATQGIPQRMPVGNPARMPAGGPPVQGGPVQVAKR